MMLRYLKSSIGVSLFVLGGFIFYPAGISAQPVTVKVPANIAWTETGITVTAGQELTIQATGRWSFDPTGSGLHGPDGVTSVKRAGAGFPLPVTSPGRLLAKIGDQIRPLGARAQLKVPVDGELLLGINDAGVEDNEGTLTVTLTTKGGTKLRQITTPKTKKVTIHVQDQQQRPLAGYWVSVHVAQELGGQKKGKEQTDRQGNYIIELPHGKYRASVYDGDQLVLDEGFLVPTHEGDGSRLTLTIR